MKGRESYSANNNAYDDLLVKVKSKMKKDKQ